MDAGERRGCRDVHHHHDASEQAGKLGAQPNARDYCTGRLSALAYRFNPTAKKLLAPYASGLTLSPVTNDQRVKQ
jgi:hypothetical protein